jgi:hypothetical protein
MMKLLMNTDCFNIDSTGNLVGLALAPEKFRQVLIDLTRPIHHSFKDHYSEYRFVFSGETLEILEL